MIEAGEWEQQVREHLWHDLEAEHRHLSHVLEDVAGLVREGSFETARRRFGEYRLAMNAICWQSESWKPSAREFATPPPFSSGSTASGRG